MARDLEHPSKGNQISFISLSPPPLRLREIKSFSFSWTPSQAKSNIFHCLEPPTGNHIFFISLNPPQGKSNLFHFLERPPSPPHGKSNRFHFLEIPPKGNQIVFISWTPPKGNQIFLIPLKTPPREIKHFCISLKVPGEIKSFAFPWHRREIILFRFLRAPPKGNQIFSFPWTPSREITYFSLPWRPSQREIKYFPFPGTPAPLWTYF